MPSYKLKDCDVCGGSLTHHTVCNRCGGGREENMVVKGRRWLCAICDNSNPVQFVCDKCGSRFIYEEVVLSEEKGLECPICKSELAEGETICRKCNSKMRGQEEGIVSLERHDASRLRRRKKGEYDEDDVKEISRIPGVGRERASSLCRAGFNSLWKIKRALEDDLCTVPGIGNETARRIKISTNLILVLSSKKSKEDIMSEERSCPNCGLPTSVFYEKCLDCNCEFDSEEIDETLRAELLADGPKAMVEFYGQAVGKKTDDPKLWYALALALKATKRYTAAKKAIEKALKFDPDNPKLAKLETKLKSVEKETPDDRKPKVQKKVAEIVEVAATTVKMPEKIPDSLPEKIEITEPEPPMRSVELQCPRCNEFAPMGKESCPSCGFLLSKAPSVPLEEVKPPAEAKPEITEAPESKAPETTPPSDTKPISLPEEKPPEVPKIEIVSKPRSSDSLRSAITPGRRPLLTGHGLVNGKGRVNGLINGNGFINGGTISKVWLPRSNVLQRYVAIGVALITMFLIVNTVLTVDFETRKAIAIDGDFSDWQGIEAYHDTYPSLNTAVNLTSYSLMIDASTLFFMVEVESSIFSDTQGYDALYIFLDIDADPTTGYSCGALGADYLISVEGTDGRVSSGSLKMFVGQDKLDWNRWASAGSVIARVSDSRLEGAVDTSLIITFDSSTLLASFVMDDQEGNTSEGAIAVGLDFGYLKVTQRGLRQIVQTGTIEFLQLAFDIVGPSLTLTVNDLSITHTPGTEIFGIPSRFTIVEGTQTIIIISLDATFVATGDVVEVSLEHVVADRPVTIIGNGAKAYSMSAPEEKRIDGMFADWPSPNVDTDSLPIEDPSIDIVAHDANVTSETAFFYFRTSEQTFRGSLTPVHTIKSLSPPGGGGGGAAPTFRLSGEAIVRSYIDTDPSNQNGFPIQGIAAKYLLEAKGQSGQIFSINTYRWEGRWVLFSGNPKISNGLLDVEMSLTIPGLVMENYTYIIETRNWRGMSDKTVIMNTKSQGNDRTRGLDFVIRGSATLMLAFPTASPPTIDGDWSSTEWQDADSYDTGNITVYTMQDGTNVYICVRVTDDTTYNSGDFVRIAFDTDNEDETGPDQWDKMFGARDPDGSSVIEDFNGDGTTWDPSYVSPYFWEANGTRDMSDGNVITFEFLIPFIEVWNTSTPSSGQRAGMAIHAHDDRGTGYDFYWGSSNLDDPSTFGHLDIPEFHDIFLILVMMPIILVMIRRSGKVNKHKGH